MLSGSSRFDGRVQRQQIGLIGNGIDHVRDTVNIITFMLDAGHGVRTGGKAGAKLLNLAQHIRHNTCALLAGTVDVIDAMGDTLHLLGHRLGRGGHLLDSSRHLVHLT